MATAKDLDALDSVLLAVMCKKLSQDASAAPDVREHALELKEHWLRLTEPEFPNYVRIDDPKQLQRELAALKSRMVTFLAPFV